MERPCRLGFSLRPFSLTLCVSRPVPAPLHVPPMTDRLLRVETPLAAYAAAVEARRKGRTVGLVPTMGALHEGHLSLVDAAKARCDLVAVTIFVNPTQFGEGEDLERYPRDLEGDIAALESRGVNLVFHPAAEDVYAPGHSTYVEPPAVARPLEGEFRPGHFRGVTTVVLKLFNMIPCDWAFFGQKDFQQALVIRHMVHDLNVPVQIETCPIVREPDGLAMSSRNRYLSPEDRERALALVRGLDRAAEMVTGGEREAARLESEIRGILNWHGIERIDYVALADPETLVPVTQIDPPVVALVAAHVGSTRLIDNRVLVPETREGVQR